MDKKTFDFVLGKGEDYRVEFKENLSGIEKDIVAFANAEGGRILVGISDDNRIKGIEINNRLKADLQSITRNCDPPIHIELSEIDNVLVVSVPESSKKPHRCSQGFYLRTGSISQKLTVDEIRELFNKQGKLLYEEIINRDFFLKDFDAEKFYGFLKKANVSKTLPQQDLLYNMGLANSKGEFNNAAILLFGKNPSKFIPQGIITCVLYKGTGKALIIDKKDFKSGIISNYNDTKSFFYKNLRLRYEIKGFEPRKEILEIPEEALKEAIINAVSHRDYSEKGAVIQVDIFDDRIEISDPGELLFDKADFGKRSISRNPLIFGLLQRINLVEHVGSGIARMRKALADAGLPEPKFDFTNFFTVTFYRPALKETTQKTTQKTAQKIIELIIANQKITRAELAKETGLSEDGIKFNLNKLKKEGILKRIGPDKGGHWEVKQTKKKAG